jgi:hypothetical protein
MRPEENRRHVVVLFKNGKEIDGELISENDEEITLIFYGMRKIKASIRRSIIDEVREVK